MRKLWTVAAAVLSGAALILFSPNASAQEEPAPPVDVDIEVEMFSDNEDLIGLAPSAPVG